MRWALCLLLAATMIGLPLQEVGATVLRFEGELEVDYDPDSLALRPGDVGAVYITVRNVGERTLYVQVAANGVEAPGGSLTDVNNVMFILEPGGVDPVVVTIESRSRLWQDPDVSDVRVYFRWGPNATMLPGGAFQLESPRHTNIIEYDLVDDNSRGWTYVLLVVGAVAVVLAIVLIRRSRRRPERPLVDRYGEGTHGR